MLEKDIYQWIYKIPNLGKEIERVMESLEKGETALSTEDRALLDSVRNKVDKEDGKGLSTNDFTDEYKAKLDEINSAIKELLNPYIKPEVTISTSNTTFSKGSVNDIKLTIEITKGRELIQSISIYSGDTVIEDGSSLSDISNGGVFEYTTTGVNKDTTYKVVINDGINDITSDSLSVKFVSCSYFGIVDSNIEITTDTIKGLSEIVLDSKEYLATNVTTDISKIVYAYPTSYGVLISIKDTNGFECINNYTNQTIIIDNISYNVYASNECTITKFVQDYK